MTKRSRVVDNNDHDAKRQRCESPEKGLEVLKAVRENDATRVRQLCTGSTVDVKFSLILDPILNADLYKDIVLSPRQVCISPITYASAFRGRGADMIRVLLELGASARADDFALNLAIRNGAIDNVCELLRAGVAPNLAKPDVKEYSVCRHSDPMALAAMSGNVDVVRVLVENGARVRNLAWQHTVSHATNALFVAADYGHVQLAHWLLAETDLSVDEPRCPGRHHETAMHAAAHADRLALVHMMHAQFAGDVNAKTVDLQTPLFWACKASPSRVLGAALQYLAVHTDADANALDDHGTTPLCHLALYHYSEPRFKVLACNAGVMEFWRTSATVDILCGKAKRVYPGRTYALLCDVAEQRRQTLNRHGSLMLRCYEAVVRANNGKIPLDRAPWPTLRSCINEALALTELTPSLGHPFRLELEVSMATCEITNDGGDRDFSSPDVSDDDDC
jgi:Ankyrin repeats (3 copies)